MKKLLNTVLIISCFVIAIANTHASTFFGRRAALFSCGSGITVMYTTRNAVPVNTAPPTPNVQSIWFNMRADQQMTSSQYQSVKNKIQTSSIYKAIIFLDGEPLPTLREAYTRMQKHAEANRPPIDQSRYMKDFDLLIQHVFSKQDYDTLVKANIYSPLTAFQLRVLAVITNPE